MDSIIGISGGDEKLKFEWDEEKNLINKRKHGIFEHSIEEDRYIAIGCVGDVLFVVFTERKENIRLISARLANEAERRLYYDQNIHY